MVGRLSVRWSAEKQDRQIRRCCNLMSMAVIEEVRAGMHAELSGVAVSDRDGNSNGMLFGAPARLVIVGHRLGETRSTPPDHQPRCSTRRGTVGSRLARQLFAELRVDGFHNPAVASRLDPSGLHSRHEFPHAIQGNPKGDLLHVASSGRLRLCLDLLGLGWDGFRFRPHCLERRSGLFQPRFRRPLFRFGGFRFRLGGLRTSSGLRRCSRFGTSGDRFRLRYDRFRTSRCRHRLCSCLCRGFGGGIFQDIEWRNLVATGTVSRSSGHA